MLQDSIDARIYLARPQLEDPLVRALLHERNALLLGPPGSGKTTLLRKVESALRETGRRTVWINAGLADDAAGLLQEVEWALRDLDREDGEGAPIAGGARPSGLLALTAEIASHRPAAILVDGLLDEEVAFDLFGRLRDELWTAHHVWLVAATEQRSATLRTPPAEAFWSTVIEIPPLGPEEIKELLFKGLDDDEWRRIRADGYPVSGVHPRELIRELGATLEGDGERGRRFGALTEEAGRLGRSEEVALTELIGLGRPASAHDDELLERLGWSRAYTQRIFAALESAHLVRSIPEPSKERGGRPRKLYEPNLRRPA